MYQLAWLFLPAGVSAFLTPHQMPSSPSSSRCQQTLGIQMVQGSSPGVAVQTRDGDDDEGSNKKKKWWQDFELKHAHVAESTRGDFEILEVTIGDKQKPLVYLDSAATSQKPNEVIDAISHYYKKLNSNVHRGAHTLSREATAAFEASRDTVANFINANSRNEVIFTSGATEAINLVASTYGRKNIKQGDEIVLSEIEHHSNIIPWQMLAEETGATIRYVKVDKVTGALDMAEMESFLNEKTKMVSVQHVSNVMGCINPVKDMIAMVREKAPNAKFMLDACQSVPHKKVDVQELGADFLAASGHKMCGPTGIGFLWGKEDILNSMPPYMGGGEMIDQVTIEGSTFAKAPARFEAGTPPIAQAIGMAAAIKYLEKIGMDNVEAYEHELADYLHRRMNEVKGVEVLGPPVGVERAALCAFTVEGVHPSDLSTFLDMEGVAIRAGHHCCQPLHKALDISHSARASLYIYNTKE
jgi:cysteine desulfurase / selenocysteine lyase